MAVMVWVGKMLSLWAVAVAVVVEAISINGFDACAWPRREALDSASASVSLHIVSTSLAAASSTSASLLLATEARDGEEGNEEDDGFDNHPREECGLIEVMGYPDAMSLCYLELQKLQHRGKEGVGIVAVWGDGKLKSVTWLGLVADGSVVSDWDLVADIVCSSLMQHLRKIQAWRASAICHASA
uniref:Glutamine amidotransferase type-2 domain-containing protein n=1 Tax=Oryza meridionalis TaxID=40149 RepID=A0A0E0E3F0_9ORYZ